ncbi:hypothetical protein GQ43DRAFT_429767 [Delitschia confertaspora ATCC 74209]|uniref:Uncharacterized protein n=1 Tax=Delitschia confertaspora ATCC 74209 TaxID=1513339 RepID=A0A9P4JSD7_9PLEO|nr:hypothetical protein GQ43DRAFT_429767 [Delitschia confertaspora ATCC 74209]
MLLSILNYPLMLLATTATAVLLPSSKMKTTATKSTATSTSALYYTIPTLAFKQNCRCLGNRKIPQFYCGYCEDVWAAADGGKEQVYGSDMVVCLPDGFREDGCYNYGYNAICDNGFEPNVWCGQTNA